LQSVDDRILSDACHMYSNMFRQADDRLLSELAQPFVVASLVSLIGTKVFSIQLPALKAIGNVLSGDDNQFINMVLINSGLEKIYSVSFDKNEELYMEMLFCCYNISCGTLNHL
jgi:hypothetical protein